MLKQRRPRLIGVTCKKRVRAGDPSAKLILLIGRVNFSAFTERFVRLFVFLQSNCNNIFSSFLLFLFVEQPRNRAKKQVPLLK